MSQYYFYPSASSSNPSVGTNGQNPAPTSSGLVAGINPSGALQPFKTLADGSLIVASDPTITTEVDIQKYGGTVTSLGQKVSASSIPIVGASDWTPNLATGAATSALQTAGNNELVTINTTLGSPFQAGGSIGNTTFASTQSGAWTVGINNFPATQPISGSVLVSNFPATQPISGTVSISGTVPVSGTFFQATQPVSIASTVPITNSPNAFTDLSGTITTANTTQTVQNGRTRNYIIFQNLSTSTMYLNFASSPTANGSGFAILPYASFSMDGFNISEDGIYVSCATAGAAYECKVI